MGNTHEHYDIMGNTHEHYDATTNLGVSVVQEDYHPEPVILAIQQARANLSYVTRYTVSEARALARMLRDVLAAIDATPCTDAHAGYHQFEGEDGEPFGSFEVFHFAPEDVAGEEAPTRFHDEDGSVFAAGWYWWACFPGCLPDGDPVGPFDTSTDAYDAARGDA